MIFRERRPVCNLHSPISIPSMFAFNRFSSCKVSSIFQQLLSVFFQASSREGFELFTKSCDYDRVASSSVALTMTNVCLPLCLPG